MEFGHQKKDFTVWVDDVDYGGMVSEVKPVIKRKTESRRPGGNGGTLESFHGIEELKLELTFKALSEKLFRLLSNTGLAAKTVFLRSAFQDEFTMAVVSDIYEFKGRCLTPDMGLDFKAGEDIEAKLEFALVFLKRDYAGVQQVYIDLQNNDIQMAGTDETSSINAALGR